MILYHRDHTLVIGAVGVMKVRLIHENHRFAWRFADEFTEFILGRNAGSGVVRVTNIDQSSLRGGKHLWQIMHKAGGQGHLYDFGAVDCRLLQDRFKSGISGDECPARFPGKRLRAELQDLAGTIAEQDLIVIDAV
jgi:hypothetical protein